MFACLQDLANAAGVFLLSRHLPISVAHDILRSSPSVVPVSLPTPQVLRRVGMTVINLSFFAKMILLMVDELQRGGFGLRVNLSFFFLILQ